MKLLLSIFSMSLLLMGCGSSDDSSDDGTPNDPTETMYFPPLSGDVWETKTVSDMGWNEDAVQPLLDFLSETHAKGFIITVNGRIVMENYFNDHSATTPWYWASAGKTLTSSMTGIAEQQGFLNLESPVSDYLGEGWTSLTASQESQIKVKHLLTMTSGLDDVNEEDCVDPDCLIYTAAPGTRWAYDNVYVKLQDVVAAASGQSWTAYFNSQLRDKIGMTGAFLQTGDLNVYWSTTRSMARFGLLALNNGKWDTTQVIPEAFHHDATSPSQTINKSYGYLWWINGESSYHLPQSQLEFPGSLIPDAPNDLYMALGKNDQKIYVIPSKKMVIVRMGEQAEESNFALSEYDDHLWEKLNALIN
ncbi:MAG: class C beta-lactamase-related serine hydrolase [Flavobacterium sp.]|uniref:serine hydrolase domain-containing protein n=1 Tax=Flavobacterium sp. TaxID=239 RepID=UPI001224F367|nr:serine hydrolase [Flavobacterium sp.]RZJ65331.1 MAG: class C beta-lactamase-related serine hydrolase [Flavobacterium sp.]